MKAPDAREGGGGGNGRTGQDSFPASAVHYAMSLVIITVTPRLRDVSMANERDGVTSKAALITEHEIN